MVSVHKKMMERIAAAQRRQKKDYARRLGKGVKSFLFQVDDIVEKRNMRPTTRKGDTLEPLWMGPYRVMKVAGQRVTLFDFRLKRELRTTVAHDHLRPKMSGTRTLAGECTDEPPSAATKSSPSSAQPSRSSAQPAPSSAQPAPSTAKPAPSSAQPAPSSAQPTSSSAQPAPSSAQPSPSSAQPTPSSAQPTPSSAQPAPSSAQPAPSSAQPAPSTAQPAPSSAQPAPSTAQPAPSTAQPAPSTTQPAPSSAQPAPSSGQQPSSSGQPAPSSQKPDRKRPQRYSKVSSRRLDVMIDLLQRDKYLTDEHIDHAQGMMKQQFPSINMVYRQCRS